MKQVAYISKFSFSCIFFFDGRGPPNFFSGDNGKGILERRIGTGAYFDILCIKLGRDDALRATAKPHPFPERLPIKSLILSGFAVDDNAFFKYFDPEKLRNVTFRDRCVSFGLALPTYMRENVQVTWPSGPAKKRQGSGHTIERAVRGRNVRAEEIKVVDIKPRIRSFTKTTEPVVSSRNVESIPAQLRPGSPLELPKHLRCCSDPVSSPDFQDLCEFNTEDMTSLRRVPYKNFSMEYIRACSDSHLPVKYASDSLYGLNSANSQGLGHPLSQSELFLSSLSQSQCNL